MVLFPKLIRQAGVRKKSRELYRKEREGGPGAVAPVQKWGRRKMMRPIPGS